jgi:hypothetical protein
LSPQPRHILDASADVGSRGEVDEIYNGLLLLAHSTATLAIVREFQQFDAHQLACK